jgi:hypothetical protein
MTPLSTKPIIGTQKQITRYAPSLPPAFRSQRYAAVPVRFAPWSSQFAAAGDSSATAIVALAVTVAVRAAITLPTRPTHTHWTNRRSGSDSWSPCPARKKPASGPMSAGPASSSTQSAIATALVHDGGSHGFTASMPPVSLGPSGPLRYPQAPKTSPNANARASARPVTRPRADVAHSTASRQPPMMTTKNASVGPRPTPPFRLPTAYRWRNGWAPTTL